MQVARKAVSAALFALLKDCYPWNLADRRMQVPDDLTAMAQPALLLVKPAEDSDENQAYGLGKYHLNYFVLILARRSAMPDDVMLEDVLDDMLDAVEVALKSTPPFDKQTLGGLVNHCWISGRIAIDTPVLFEQAAVWIPITVEVGS